MARNTMVLLVLALCAMHLGAVYSSTAATKTSEQTPVQEKDVVDKTATEEYDTALDIDDYVAAETIRELNLTALGIDVKPDPLIGKYAEGDIAVRNVKQFVEDSNKRGKNAIRSSWRHWPRGEVPYTMSSRYGSYSRSVIARAMAQYHKHTCIRFVPRDSAVHRDYIYIVPDDGCYSLVGRTGGRQPVSLDAGCIQTGTVIHELMHAVGFFHEQSRNDRDQHIDIDWSNVMTEAVEQFDKYSLRTISHLGADYDYGSIMHYGPYAFTSNGRRTIRPKKSLARGVEMGQRSGFSEIDLEKINSLYNCATTGDRDGEEVPETATTLRPKVKECKDLDWRCKFYKMSAFGYCGDGPDEDLDIKYRLCPKSCDVCDKEVEQTRPTTRPTTRRPAPTTGRPTQPPTTTRPRACRDYNKACGRWSRNGHCTRAGYRGFMADTCPLSCERCTTDGRGGDVTTGPPPGERCADNPRFTTTCTVSKMLGRCASKGSKKYCRKTCGYC